MATWLKSRDGDVCPKNGQKLSNGGSRYEPRAYPCECGGRCADLAQARAYPWNVSVQCKYKAVEVQNAYHPACDVCHEGGL